MGFLSGNTNLKNCIAPSCVLILPLKWQLLGLLLLMKSFCVLFCSTAVCKRVGHDVVPFQMAPRLLLLLGTSFPCPRIGLFIFNSKFARLSSRNDLMMKNQCGCHSFLQNHAVQPFSFCHYQVVLLSHMIDAVFFKVFFKIQIQNRCDAISRVVHRQTVFQSLSGHYLHSIHKGYGVHYPSKIIAVYIDC